MSADRYSRFLSAAGAATLALAFVVADDLAGGAQAESRSFRVCADPNNLPFSRSDGSGFENKLAELIASDLGERLVYTWRPQRRAYIRTTLKAGECDAIMGVPAQLGPVTATRPYYRSRYVFISRTDRNLGNLTSISDPRLKDLSIGVQLIGDDGYNTPPAHALSEQGIVANLVGYTVYGDYRQPNPPARIIDAVVNGAVDIAAVWGPLAGYFAPRATVPLTLTPITETAKFKPLRFDYAIAVGVRKGDDALKTPIDAVLGRRKAEIAQLLAQYGVPLVSDGVASEQLN